MSKIYLLSPDNIKHIAAGEVILGYTSVVKELLENAIDAGSTYIKIIYSGEELEIIDNGCGMNKEDLALCTQPYTTSKFVSLDNITTFGFRGEALHSIVTVSKCIIITKQTEIGLKLENNIISPTAANNGTHIIVKDLFYNFPVRKKFMPKDENKMIEKILYSYVLSHAHITIRYQNQCNTQVFTQENINNIIFGPKHQTRSFNFLIPQDLNLSYRFHGFNIINPTKTYNQVYIFVNNRPVKYSKILNIFKQANETLCGQSNFGLVCFIECHPTLVDVNIHPAKTEVNLLCSNIYKKLSELLLFPQVEIPPNNHEQQNHEHMNINCQEHSHINEPWNINPHNYSNINENMNSHEHLNAENHLSSQHHSNHFSTQHHSKPLNASLLKESCNEFVFAEEPIYLGVIALRYLLFKIHNKLVIMDQHAAHERIIAEELKNTKFPKQYLLTPYICKNYAFIEMLTNRNLKTQLSEIIEYELVDNHLIIHAVPSILTIDEIINFISHYKEHQSIEAMFYDFLHEYGCKNSIRSGDELTSIEAITLYQKLIQTHHYHMCNHGRPTLIEFSFNKLNNLFGR